MSEVRPLRTLAAWLVEARDAGLPEHDAVALTTAGADGRPTARIVWARRVEPDAVVFTTALWTRKVRDLADNPNVRCCSTGRRSDARSRSAGAPRSPSADRPRRSSRSATGRISCSRWCPAKASR